MKLAVDDLSPTSEQFAVDLVDRVLRLAVQSGASDVHFHPREQCWEILFRVNGVLHVVTTIAKSDHSDPVSRLMVLAKLPAYQASEPLEGPLTFETDQRNAEMRLATFPTVAGTRAVIRIMESQQPFRDLDSLGLDDQSVNDLKSICQHRQGLVLIVGPAGSGKTTTLYAALQHIAGSTDQRRSVLTIEDPVERVIETISQSQVNSNTGMTLASAMRSAVRQDPEVLLVSEIRDPETAREVLSASLTGHLCFSSMHAPDVATAVYRLSQMGLPSHLVQGGLLAVCTQRLFRKRCDACHRAPESHEQEVHRDSNCPSCHATGYSGRVPLAQFVKLSAGPVGEAISDALVNDGSLSRIRSAAAEAGLPSIEEAAKTLVKRGLTDEPETFRVLGL